MLELGPGKPNDGGGRTQPLGMSPGEAVGTPVWVAGSLLQPRGHGDMSPPQPRPALELVPPEAHGVVTHPCVLCVPSPTSPRWTLSKGRQA